MSRFLAGLARLIGLLSVFAGLLSAASSWPASLESKMVVSRPANLPVGGFGPSFDLKQGRLAVWQARDQGRVSVFDLSGATSATHRYTIVAPNSTYDNPSFGHKLAFSGPDRLFVGNPFTWISAPHDGVIYSYSIAAASAAQLAYTFGQSPHSAGYFGSELATGGDLLVSAQGSNSGWGTRSAAFYYRLNSDQTLTFLGREDRADYMTSFGAVVTGDFAAFVYASETAGELRVTKVLRQNGASASLGRSIALPLPASAAAPSRVQPAGGNSYFRVAASGSLIVVSHFGDESIGSDNSVFIYRINDLGADFSVELVGTIAAPVGASKVWGRRLAFGWNHLLVSDPLVSFSGQVGKGAVYVFNLDNPAQPTLVASLKSSRPSQAGAFGEFLAFDPTSNATGVLAVGVRTVPDDLSSDHEIEFFSVPAVEPTIVVDQSSGSSYSGPSRQIVSAGGSLSLSVSAAGATSYQWCRNGRPIPGATQSSLAVLGATPSKDNGWYQVKVSTSSATVSSRPLFVLVSGGYRVQAWGDPALTVVPTDLDDVVGISAGASHSLAIRSDGRVVSWGAASDPGTLVPSGLSNVVAVAAGSGHSVALRADGTVVGWGISEVANVPTGLSDVVAIAAGDSHALALRSDGSVVAWGYNGHGQTDVPNGPSLFSSIAAGEFFSVATKLDGSVVTWPSFGIESPLAIPSGLTNAISVSAKSGNIVALISDGTCRGWGSLGGNNFNSSAVSSLNGLSVVAAGGMYGLFLRRDGSVYGTDYGYGLQSGQAVVPAQLNSVVAVAAGYRHSLALSTHRKPQITKGVSAASASIGEPFGFSVVANAGGASMTYQWRKDGTAISGATNSSLNLVATAASGGSYDVVVTDYLGSTTSAAASLTLRPSGAPYFSITGSYPAGVNTWGDSATVAIRTGFSNAMIYYTVDGSDPLIGSSLVYDGPITIRATSVLKALAVNLDDFSSVSTDPVSIVIVPTYVLSLSSGGGGAASAAPIAARYITGSEVTLGATPDAGWSFVRWAGDASGTAASTSVVMDRNRSVQAVFGTSLATTVSGPGVLAITPASGPYAYGSTVRIFPKPNQGASFAIWGGSASGSAIPLDYTVTQAGKTVSALFSTLSVGQVNLYWDVTGYGSVSIAPQKNSYAANDTVTVTAVPAPGQVFTGWSGALSGTQNPATITLSASKSLTANFQDGLIVSSASNSRNVIIAGGTLTLSANVSGTPVPMLQWYHNGRPISGATNATYTKANVTSFADAGWYQLKATNRYETVSTGVMFVLVAGPTQVISWGANRQGEASVPPGLTDAIAVAGGEYHSLALRANGTVVAWGRNAEGQTTVPSGLSDVVAIAATDYQSLALKADGTIVAWGPNWDNFVTGVPQLTNVVAISGGRHALALRADGKVFGWGYNPYGEATVPADLGNAVDIAAGYEHSAVLLADGAIVAWGRNDVNQKIVPVGLGGVANIVADIHSSYALKADGTVAGWGERPNVPSGFSGFVSIAAKGRFVLGLRSDGTVGAWGENFYGQADVPTSLNSVVGLGAGMNHSLVVRSTVADTMPVFSSQPVASASGAIGQVLGLSANALAGTAPVAYQWRKDATPIAGATASSYSVFIGSDSSGSYDVVVSNYLGSVTSSAAVVSLLSSPRLNEIQGGRLAVTEGSSFTVSVDPAMVAAGSGIQWFKGGKPLQGATNSSLTVAGVVRHRDDDWYQVRVTAAGTTRASAPLFVRIPVAKPVVVAWGAAPVSAVFGSGITQGVIPASRQVSGVVAGGDYAIIIDQDGTPLGWGNPQNPGTTVPAGVSSVVEVATGDFHVLAVRADGSVVAWGANAEGQISLPQFPDRVVKVAASGNASFALMANGKVMSWGSNSGGRNTVPEDLDEVVKIATAGGIFGHPMVNIALKANGEIVHWGGPGASFAAAPTGDIVDVKAKTWYGFAISASGGLIPWGETYGGVLESPNNLKSIKQLAVGDAHSVAITSGKTLAVWGANGGAWGADSPATLLPPSGLATFEMVTAGNGFSIGVHDGAADIVPVISTPPVAAIAATVGQVATLKVAAAGGDTVLGYQWRKNGVAISGATNAEYKLILDSASAANYTVTVSNYLGAITSSAAVVSLSPTPLVSDVLGGRVVLNQGSAGQLAAAASFVPAGSSLQWKRNGLPIAGATSSTLAISNASVILDGGLYTLEVTKAGVVSRSAPLYVVVSSPGRLVTWGKWQTGVPAVPATLPSLVAFSAGLNESYLFGLGLKADGKIVSIPWGDTGGGQTTVPSTLDNVVQVAAGGLHGVALRSDGTVFTWGYNSRGQVSKVNGLGGVIGIAAAGEDTLVLRADGTVAAWGLLSDSVPVPADLSGVIAVAGGMEHYVALKADGRVVAWGNGGSGRTAVPTDLTGVVAVAAGWNHSLALKSDGSVVGWGANDHGQSTPPAGLTGVVAIAAGGWHSMALKSDGTVVTWGSNLNDQSSVPVSLVSAFAVGASQNHSFALRDSSGDLAPTITTQPAAVAAAVGQSTRLTVAVNAGTAPVSYQWRKNGVDIAGATLATLDLTVAAASGDAYAVVISNYLGSVTSAPANLTVRTSPLVSATQGGRVVVPKSGTMTIELDSGMVPPGATVQWRRNGRIIAGSTGQSLGIINAAALKDGGWYQAVVQVGTTVTQTRALFVVVNGLTQVTAWGDGSIGKVAVPSGLGDAVQIASSYNLSLALKASGNVVAWGRFRDGTMAAVPTAADNVVAIAAGHNQALAVRSDGSVVAWNSAGLVQIPFAVSDAVAVSAGENFALLLRANGTVLAWGDNSSGQTDVPAGLSNVIAIAAGATHAGALRNDGTVVAWGRNDLGQCDVLRNIATGVRAIACGIHHSLALKEDGTIVVSNPQSAPLVTNAIAIAAGLANHSIVVLADGKVRAWGTNEKGQVDVPSDLTSAFSVTGGYLTSFALRDASGDLAPTIASQPTNQALDEGTPLTFSVTVNSGTAGVTYQWRKGGAAISGASNASYTLTEALSGDAGSYDVVVSNYLGSVTSAAAVLTINPSTPPSVTVPPQSLTATAGQAVTFAVTAAGSPPRYQWLRNGGAISGATNATLTFPATTLADAGRYAVQLTNRAGTVTSAEATLTVNAAPVITAQPSSQTVLSGAVVTLAVTATGYPAPTYQWKFNDSVIAGATNASLVFNPVKAADAGPYRVTITSALGTVTSVVANLTVNVPPAITTQPMPVASIPGASATFSVVASGFPAPTYQWYKGTDPIAGAFGASLTLSPVSTADAGQYKVVVTNAVGTVTSSAVLLTVNIPPVITTQPAASKSITAGNAVDFIVVATGTPSPTYQWRKDGVAISGATSSVYTIAAVAAADAGSYTVVVSNAGGTVTSTASVLTVLASSGGGGGDLPVITQQPASTTANVGGSASFTVAATTSSGTLAYQWRKDGVVITGATGSTYTIGNVQQTHAGNYLVTVSNGANAVASGSATLTVGSAVAITTQPASVSVNAGSSATLGVAASGSGPLTYVWRKNGNVVLGAITATYTIPEAGLADAGAYTVTVSNSVNEVTSQAATVTVNTLPLITAQPQGQTIAVGGALALSVTATGTPTPTYVWKKDGVAVAGATQAVYTVAAAQAGNAGGYTVEVSNSVGTVTSAPATVTVVAAPVITRQPATQTANLGGRVTLTVTATGASPLAYQWRRNGTAIVGATSATYRFLAGDATAESGTYDVVVTAGGTAATTTSSLAAVTVYATPFFSSSLTGACEVAVGEAVTLTAVDTTTAASNLRWRLNGKLIPNVNGRILTLASVKSTDAGWYQLQTTSATGAVSVSAAVFVQVRVPSQTIAWGSNTLGQATVPATLTDPLQISAGYSHTLAVRTGGVVGGFGSNTAKQLTFPTGLAKVVRVAAGYSHSVALVSDGTVVAWGETTALQNLVPSSLGGVVSVAAGRVHTLALKSNGGVVGWGEPSYGQEIIPNGLANVVAIAAGSDHSLALKSDGTVVAWGNSDNGRTTIPAGLTNVIAIAAGAEHSLALRADGRVIAWGKADNNRIAVPADLTGVVAIAAGQAHSVALKSDGTLVAWGLNAEGQTNIPYGLGSVYQLSAAGGFHNVALRDRRSDLQPGILTSPDSRLVPVGAPVSLAVTGNFGTAPLSVVWTKDGVAVPGATSATYTLPEIAAGAAGVYQAKVTNYLGTATSGTATIQVNAPLGGSAAQILVPPSATAVLSGQPVTLKVEAAGTPPLNYVWKRDGAVVSGASKAALTVANVTTPANYTVEVTAAVGTAATASAAVSVVTAQAGLSPVQSGYVEGTNVTLQASLTYTGSPASLGYGLVLPPGWSFVSATDQAQVRPAAGSTDTLGWAWSTIPPSPNTLVFNVVLAAPADSVGAMTLAGTAIVRTGGTAYELPLTALTLPQVSAPRIVSQPVSRVIGAGTSTILAVVVSGQAPFTYTWTHNGQPVTDGWTISGSGTATLSLSGVTTADAGDYQCTVVNAAGTVVSSVAGLSVVSVAPVHSLGSGGYTPGGTVTVASAVAHANAAGVLSWSVLLPSDWSLVSSTGDEGALRPTAGTKDLLEWIWPTLPASPFAFSYVLRVPESSAGDKQLSALVGLQQGIDSLVQITAKPDPLIVPHLLVHSADIDRNLQISLSELTRVIELYNTRNGSSRTGCYGVQFGTEDGFVATPTRLAAEKPLLMIYHSADSNRDGKIGLSELTRVIELYNTRNGSSRTGRYRLQTGTEDGFAPGL